MRVIKSESGIIKIWDDFVPVDEKSINQLKKWQIGEFGQ